MVLCVDHGTHVAGTIGGRAGTSGTVAGTDVALTDLSGVAPGALLGNYNVFPCVGAFQEAAISPSTAGPRTATDSEYFCALSSNSDPDCGSSDELTDYPC